MKKTLIAASIGAVMMAAVGTASANSLLFPYFTTTSGAQSALSIASNNGVAAAGETLHYVYNYGAACTHFDGTGKVTNNDLLQHSVAAPAAGGFGKAVGSDASTPFYFPLANTTGFLVVTNTTTPGVRGISGDMAIVDPSTGLVASYAGISNDAAAEGDFSGILDGNFNLSAYSANVTNTSWYGVVAGNMNAAITGNRNWDATASVSNLGVVYDNDEKPFSGLVSKKITCAGSIVPTDLLTSAQAAAVGSNGGLIHALTTFPAPAAPLLDQGTGLVLSKLQFVKPAVGAPFAGKMFMHRENGFAF
ncbi:MAG: hypothetical protein ABIR13_00115 [Polaromonas sp.]